MAELSDKSLRLVNSVATMVHAFGDQGRRDAVRRLVLAIEFRFRQLESVANWARTIRDHAEPDGAEAFYDIAYPEMMGLDESLRRLDGDGER